MLKIDYSKITEEKSFGEIQPGCLFTYSDVGRVLLKVEDSDNRTNAVDLRDAVCDKFADTEKVRILTGTLVLE